MPAVAECGDAGDPQLVRVEAVQARDDSVEEVLAGIDVMLRMIRSASWPNGGEMKQQIDTCGEQKQAAQNALDRDQTDNDTRARRVAGAHRES